LPLPTTVSLRIATRSAEHAVKLPRYVLIVSLAAAFVGLTSGCDSSAKSSSSAAGHAPGGRLQIAVIPKGTTHEFWKSVHYGAAQAAKEFDVDIVWKGPVNENNRTDQINIVQDFVHSGVDGIVLAPIDKVALVRPVRQAKSAGIPTVVFDSGLDDAESIVCYVATDNEHGGELAAQTLAKSLGEKGNVILLRYNVNSESTHLREEGFLKELKKFPNIKILSDNQYSGTTRDSSLDVSQRLLSSFQDQVQGVFAVCEPNGVGMFGALKAAQLDGKVKFVGFDPSPALIEAMRQGKMQGIVLQDPVQMGYLSVKTIVEHLRGKPVEKRISTGEFVATPENLDTPEMKKLLEPPLFE
jgi:ribose transport system substrate-binding protein